jgi:hypothetical protein
MEEKNERILYCGTLFMNENKGKNSFLMIKFR